MRIVMLFIFCMGCCVAQQVSINTFEWLEKDNVFVFSGETSLPKGSKIKIVVCCGESTIRTQWLKIKSAEWSGYMHFPQSHLLPGVYTLQIKVPSSNADHYTKMYFYKKHLHEKIDEKLRAELLGFLDEARVILDSLVLSSYHIMWQTPQRERAAAWQSLTQKIQISAKRKLVEQSGQKTVVHPYLFSLQKIHIVFAQLQKLQNIFAAKIASGDENFPFFLVQNIEKNAVASLEAMKVTTPWTYGVSCAKERYTIDKKIYRSSSSRFKLFLPKLPRKIKRGDKNCAQRVVFSYRNMQCSVYMLSLDQFSGDRQIQALKIMSAYIWKWHITNVTTSLIRTRRAQRKIYKVSLLQTKKNKYQGAIAVPGRQAKLFLIMVETNKATQAMADNFLQRLAESFRG